MLVQFSGIYWIHDSSYTVSERIKGQRSCNMSDTIPMVGTFNGGRVSNLAFNDHRSKYLSEICRCRYYLLCPLWRALTQKLLSLPADAAHVEKRIAQQDVDFVRGGTQHDNWYRFEDVMTARRMFGTEGLVNWCYPSGGIITEWQR